MNSFRNIVIFGNARWREDTCGNSSQQLAVAFLQLGFRVVYISPNRSKPESVPYGPEKFHSMAISDGVLQEMQKVLIQWQADETNTVFICSMATRMSQQLLKFFSGRGFPVIYRCVDWFDSSVADHVYDRDATMAICRAANVIALSHPELLQSLPQVGARIITMTNGVDYDLFRRGTGDYAKPADLRKGKITIGFWGSFWGNRVDWNLVRMLAARNPNWELNFIGELQYLDADASKFPDNVHFLGLKKKEELPAYVKHFDLCLIPYRQDLNFARYSNPIKALESLAALKPVVAPENPSLLNYPGLFFYSFMEQAEERIKESITKELDRDAVLDCVCRNTWKEKARQLLYAVANL